MCIGFFLCPRCWVREESSLMWRQKRINSIKLLSILPWVLEWRHFSTSECPSDSWFPLFLFSQLPPSVWKTLPFSLQKMQILQDPLLGEATDIAKEEVFLGLPCTWGCFGAGVGMRSLDWKVWKPGRGLRLCAAGQGYWVWWGESSTEQTAPRTAWKIWDGRCAETETTWEVTAPASPEENPHSSGNGREKRIKGTKLSCISENKSKSSLIKMEETASLEQQCRRKTSVAWPVLQCCHILFSSLRPGTVLSTLQVLAHWLPKKSHFADGDTEAQRTYTLELGFELKPSDSRCHLLNHLLSHGELWELKLCAFVVSRASFLRNVNST